MTSSLRTYPLLNLEELQPKVQNKLYFKRLEMLKEIVNMMNLKIKLMRSYQESSRGSNTEMSLLTLAETKLSSDEMSYFLEKASEVATGSLLTSKMSDVNPEDRKFFYQELTIILWQSYSCKKYQKYTTVL